MTGILTLSQTSTHRPTTLQSVTVWAKKTALKVVGATKLEALFILRMDYYYYYYY